LHERVVNLFNTASANDTCDLRGVWVNLRGFGKEGFKISAGIKLCLKPLLIVSGQPHDNFVEFGFGSAFSLDFLYVKRVYRRELHFENTFAAHFLLAFIGNYYTFFK